MAEQKNSYLVHILTGVVFFGGFLAFCSGKPDTSKGMRESDALLMCQMALKKISRDPEKADIPYVDDQGKGTEYYYAWGNSTKLVRMRNGLGLEVAATASCTVDGKTQRITSLTLDGKTIL